MAEIFVGLVSFAMLGFALRTGADFFVACRETGFAMRQRAWSTCEPLDSGSPWRAVSFSLNFYSWN